jgi:hypothetical protein
MPMRVRYILSDFQIYADQTVGVIQDAKFKRREALADLAKASSKK